MKPTMLCASLALLVLTGCNGPDHAAAIRGRFQQVATHLTAGDVDACLPFVDPLYIRGQGTDGVKFRLGLVTALVRLGGLKAEDIRVDEVRLSDDKKTAETPYSLHERHTDLWKSQPPLKWVLYEGQWYLTF